MTNQGRKIQGIGVGQRTALGMAYCYVRAEATVHKKQIPDPHQEVRRLSESADQVRTSLTQVANTLSQTNEHSAAILLAQMEFLDDPGYLGEVEQIIMAEQINAEAAVEMVCNTLVQEFSEIEDEYFRERASDIKDISSKLIADLSGLSLSSLSEIRSPSIVVTDDLLPSDTAQLNPDYVLGFCTAKGAATSHTALLANSLGIPAVVGCGHIPAETGDTVIINGTDGLVWIDPPADVCEETEQKIAAYNKREQELIVEAQKPAVTRDGTVCAVYANIASAAEAKKAIAYGAEGSGLLRTEFFFYQEDAIPTEDRQYEMYLAMADIMGDRPITIRTLDIGGDKPLKALQGDYEHEQNPFLGLRGVRLTDTQPKLFASQLRALIRVATDSDAEIKVMFPFVSTVAEVQRLCRTMRDCHKQLEDENNSTYTLPPTGVMIEIPSAALMIDSILHYVDFVSIGTNDLAQYTCAVDRTNEQVNALADYCHPGLLRLINMVLEAGTRNNKDVSICGEMAGDPLLIPLLSGMGLSTYSMAAVSIPPAKELLSRLNRRDCTTLRDACLKAETIPQVRRLLEQFAST